MQLVSTWADKTVKTQHVQCLLLIDRGRLCVGSYLHCMVSGGDHFDLATGESRVVTVVADPRQVHRSEVFCSYTVQFL